MRNIRKTLARRLTGRWLSGTAVYAVVGAWAAIGVYGWLNTADGLMAGLAIVLTIGCAVFGSRAFKNAADAATLGQRVALWGLGGACLLFTGWSGHNGLAVSENARWAPYEAAEADRQASEAVDAAIAAVPPLPLSDEQGRPLGPVRTDVLAKAREREIARLEARRPMVAEVARPSPRMPEALSWAIVGLVEALELLGAFALAGERRLVRASTNPGRDLAMLRWA